MNGGSVDVELKMLRLEPSHHITFCCFGYIALDSLVSCILIGLIKLPKLDDTHAMSIYVISLQILSCILYALDCTISQHTPASHHNQTQFLAGEI